jgi:hypothetical protein
MKVEQEARLIIIKALRREGLQETIVEKILSVHDLAILAADQKGFDRAARLAYACGESQRGRFLL